MKSKGTFALSSVFCALAVIVPSKTSAAPTNHRFLFIPTLLFLARCSLGVLSPSCYPVTIDGPAPAALLCFGRRRGAPLFTKVQFGREVAHDGTNFRAGFLQMRDQAR